MCKYHTIFSQDQKYKQYFVWTSELVKKLITDMVRIFRPISFCLQSIDSHNSRLKSWIQNWKWWKNHCASVSLVLMQLLLPVLVLLSAEGRNALPKTSVAPGRPSMLCLRFCFVLCRPWFPIFNPCYVINFKLEFLRPDRTKCLETWYHYCILPNLKNSLLQFLEKMSLLEDACLGLDFPFLALAMI